MCADADICLSTDSEKIKQVAEDYGLTVPFLRPAELATDKAPTADVILHALDYYRSLGRDYDTVLLLQPTSPLRRGEQIKEALKLYESTRPDMVVSVRPAAANPYYDILRQRPTARCTSAKAPVPSQGVRMPLKCGNTTEPFT